MAPNKSSMALDPNYKSLCESVAQFAFTLDMNEKQRSHLSTIVAIAIRIDSNHP